MLTFLCDVNLSDFMFLLVDYGRHMCNSFVIELQQNSCLLDIFLMIDSLKWRWLLVDIYWDMPLATDTETNNIDQCFSRWLKQWDNWVQWWFLNHLPLPTLTILVCNEWPNSHHHWFCYKLIVILSPGTDFVKNYES